jgi:hypothetical protein
MAYKRKRASAKKAAPRRRRRIGASNRKSGINNLVTGFVGMMTGALACKYVPVFKGLNSTLQGGILAGAGYFLPSTKIAMVSNPFFGAGLGSYGGYKIVQSTGLINGMGALPAIAGYRRARQMGRLPAVAGTQGPLGTVAGVGMPAVASPSRSMKDYALMSAG